ncbi:hypothetical protein [Photorhabdus luminescens]|uniref:Uncharacterized protein n=1 Tax=Photorhabdus luminescens subsp. sonorensis TaxID=1173677 RepID=A0A5C4RF16_PHOLU|nr:hypothetical protein [Photorhabdus luminescens]TNH42475.1 hypothetical protein EP164_16475 [Photorhabdus luminescens subsp. sonorensis]
MARKNQHDEYDKIGLVLPLPIGYSKHMRDPKVMSGKAKLTLQCRPLCNTYQNKTPANEILPSVKKIEK